MKKDLRSYNSSGGNTKTGRSGKFRYERPNGRVGTYGGFRCFEVDGRWYWRNKSVKDKDFSRVIRDDAGPFTTESEAFNDGRRL
jgi:hypothetical protein